MATAVLNVPEQGQLVRVRSRQWVVNEVKPSTLPPPAMKPSFGAQHLLTLASVEDDGLGKELQVVWEVEPGAKVIEKVALPKPTEFDPPDKLDALAEMGVQVPLDLITDCVRLCCSLCLLENDPSVIEPDVLSKDKAKFEGSGDQKFVDKAHRRGKVGWNVGRRIEVAPHYRRPHMALVWTGRGRAVPRVVPRRGSVVHREMVEKVPSGFGD